MAFKAAARKLLFLSCWVNEQDESVLGAVQAALEEEWRVHGATLPPSVREAMEGLGEEGVAGAVPASMAGMAARQLQNLQQPQRRPMIQEL